MTVGRCDEAVDVMKDIAKTNNRPVPAELLQKLKVILFQVHYIKIANIKVENQSFSICIL